MVQETERSKWKKPQLEPAPKFTTQPQPKVEMTAVQRELGLADSVTPVIGVLTSGFGKRDHPISGQSSMHDGVDIAADTGTDDSQLDMFSAADTVSAPIYHQEYALKDTRRSSLSREEAFPLR